MAKVGGDRMNPGIRILTVPSALSNERGEVGDEKLSLKADKLYIVFS